MPITATVIALLCVVSVPAEGFAPVDAPFVFDNPPDGDPRPAHHVVPFGDDKGAVAVAGFHLFQDLLRPRAADDVFVGIVFDVSDNPFFLAAVARRYVSPRVDEEEVGERAACGSVTGLVASQPSVNGAVKEGASVVFEAVFEVSSPAGEQCADKSFVLLESAGADDLVVVLVEVPRVVHGTVAQFHVESYAEFVEV